MESKNPPEEIREAILESRLFGIENEITPIVSKNILRDFRINISILGQWIGCKKMGFYK